jgi:peptidoglycan/LPS O-acetylase OafA/YrhL
VGAILFYRLCRIQSRPVRRVIDLCLIALAVGCGIAAWRTGWANNKWQRNVYLELCVVASFALLLVALRPMSAWYKQATLGKWLSRLGLISYSLYLIHECNLNLVQSAVSRVVPARFTIVNQSLQLAGHIALAMVFWYFCERPFLNKRLRKPQVGVSGIAAPAVESNTPVREVLT